MIQSAIAQGIHMFVVCGGDGTISAVARTLAGTTGDAGNYSRRHTEQHGPQSGHPTEDIQAAIAILREGRRITVDVGAGPRAARPLRHSWKSAPSGWYPPSSRRIDDIQHGNLARIGEFLCYARQGPRLPKSISCWMTRREIHDLGHVVLVSNMPLYRRSLSDRLGEAGRFETACWTCCSLPTCPSWTC